MLCIAHRHQNSIDKWAPDQPRDPRDSSCKAASAWEALTLTASSPLPWLRKPAWWRPGQLPERSWWNEVSV
jgi:hypothetical protein